MGAIHNHVVGDIRIAHSLASAECTRTFDVHTHQLPMPMYVAMIDVL